MVYFWYSYEGRCDWSWIRKIAICRLSYFKLGILVLKKRKSRTFGGVITTNFITFRPDEEIYFYLTYLISLVVINNFLYFLTFSMWKSFPSTCLEVMLITSDLLTSAISDWCLYVCVGREWFLNNLGCFTPFLPYKKKKKKDEETDELKWK